MGSYKPLRYRAGREHHRQQRPDATARHAPGLTVTEAVTTKDALAQFAPAPPMSIEGASPDKPLPLRLTAKRGISISINEDDHRSISENSCKAHNESATPSAGARIMDDQRSAC